LKAHKNPGQKGTEEKERTSKVNPITEIRPKEGERGFFMRMDSE